MTSRYNPRVQAARDLQPRDAQVIPKGTAGKITGVRGLVSVRYTAVFWPDGMDGAKVLLRKLSRADLEWV